MPPSLTVVVFNFNYKRYLPQALAAISRQTRRPDRLIVTDDASPQDTLEELQAIAAPHGAEVIRNPQNLGNIAHYQARVAEVQTDAYLLCSADDYFVDDRYFADALALLHDNPRVVAVYGYHVATDESGRPLQARRYRNGADWTLLPGPELRSELALQNTVPAVCTMIRTSVHDHVAAFPLPNRHAGDWQQWYLFTYHGDFARIERPVCHYRQHVANMSVVVDRERQAARLIDEAYGELLARPELDATDRDRLLLGRTRSRIRHATLRELPGAILDHSRQPGLLPVVAETLAERAGQPLERLRRRMRAKSLGAGLSELD